MLLAIAHIKLEPMTEAGGLCSSLYLSPLRCLPDKPYSKILDLYLKGAAIFIKPVVAW